MKMKMLVLLTFMSTWNFDIYAGSTIGTCTVSGIKNPTPQDCEKALKAHADFTTKYFGSGVAAKPAAADTPAPIAIASKPAAADTPAPIAATTLPDLTSSNPFFNPLNYASPKTADSTFTDSSPNPSLSPANSGFKVYDSPTAAIPTETLTIDPSTVRVPAAVETQGQGQVKSKTDIEAGKAIKKIDDETAATLKASDVQEELDSCQTQRKSDKEIDCSDEEKAVRTLANEKIKKEAEEKKSGIMTIAKCEKEKEIKEGRAKPKKAVGNNEDQDGLTGTSLMKTCVELSGYNMRYLYSKQRQTVDWDIFIEATKACTDASANCGGANDPAKLEACNKIKQTASLCDGAAFIINEFGRDWTSPEHVKPTDVKGGTPEIKCTAVGLATLDFEGCANFVSNGAIMEAAQGAIQTGQELYYKDQATTAQMEASSSTESATAGLKALKTGIKGQEDIMTQRAALETGKFAALAKFYSDMPTGSDIEAACKRYGNKLVGGYPDGCAKAASRQHEFAFLMNQPARDKMKAKLAQVGITVVSDGVMAGLMAKRAGDIDNAIAKIDAFKPIDPLAPAADNAQTTFCQLNPGDPKCLTGGLERTFDASSDNIISFGDGGLGTTYTNKNPALDGSGATTPAGNSPAASAVIKGVGSVISAAQQNGGVAEKVAAATVTKGTAPGGGGGGGAAGGGLGGGGGGGVPAGPQAGGVSSAIQGKAPKYDGGSGTLSGSGGFGLNKGKSVAKDDSNPFGKLFNKDGNKSGALDFGRSPASQKVGSKGDNLFEMISKRYTNVSSDKRLIEYEMTK